MARRIAFALMAALFAAAANAGPVLLVFGDSLSAGYGLDRGAGWVSLLERKLKAAGSPYEVVNVSVSGETTAGGLARLPAILARTQPTIVLLQLGANDGLRGLPLPEMRSNLEKMIDMTRAAKALPVLFEMRIPPNYGPPYAERFKQEFDDVAAAKKVPLVPFFLAAIAGDRTRWFQEDTLHPTADAQPKMLDAVWPTLVPLLKLPASVSSARP
jgi:acyl-CoA thioesterase-1